MKEIEKGDQKNSDDFFDEGLIKGKECSTMQIEKFHRFDGFNYTAKAN